MSISLRSLADKFQSLDQQIREDGYVELKSFFEGVNYEIPQKQMIKICRALDYYLYNASRRPYQAEVVMNIVRLALVLESPLNAIEYIGSWWEALADRWPALDKHRVDKYLTLVRKLTEVSIDLMTTPVKRTKKKGKKGKLSPPKMEYDSERVELIIDGAFGRILRAYPNVHSMPFDLVSQVAIVFLEALEAADIPVPCDVFQQCIVMWVTFVSVNRRPGLWERVDDHVFTPALDQDTPWRPMMLAGRAGDEDETWSLIQLVDVAGMTAEANRANLAGLEERMLDAKEADDGPGPEQAEEK